MTSLWSRWLVFVLAMLVAVASNLALIPTAEAAIPNGQPNWMQGFDDPLNDGSVISTTWLGDRVYIAGTFGSAGGQTHQNVAAIDMGDRRVDHGFVADTNGPVHVVLAAPDGSGIYVGGDFSTINGVARSNVAKVNPTTGQVLPPNFSIDGPVQALAAESSRLYVGGNFNNVGAAARKDLAAFNNDVLIGNWRVNTNGKVRDLKLSDDGATLFAAGTFTALDQVPAPQRVAKIQSASGTAVPWNVTTSNSWVVIDLALSDDGGTIYLATGGPPSQGGNRTKAVDVATGQQQWSVEHGGDPQAVIFHDGLVYVGGHFEQRNGRFSHNRLQVLDEVSGATEAWSPVLNSLFGIWDLDATPWGLLVGGDFTRIDGRNNRGVAVYPQLDFGLTTPPVADNTLPTSTIQSPVAGGSISLPASVSGSSSDNVAVKRVKVIIRNFATKEYVQPDGQSLASSWAKIEPSITTGASINWSIPLSNLPAGTYRARIKTEDTAGNETDWSATHDFTISTGAGADTAAPAGAITTLPGDTMGQPGTLSGTATDNVAIQDIKVTIRNRTTKDYVQPDGQSVASSWAKLVPSITPAASVGWGLNLNSLPPGQYQARVKVTDTSQNSTSWSTSYNFSIS